jgi:DMSO/TMAO reductase YedYZ heme-binding membrane subunit
MSSATWWYIARASGLVSWALLTASVVWGLCMSTKLRVLGARPNWMLDLHRFLGGVATIFVGVHVGAIVLDSYVHFGMTDVLVPFASSWHPERVAWGVIALYLLVAVELTSLARKSLAPHLWRAIHTLSLPLFVLATLHFVLAGTDAGAAVAIAAVVMGLTVFALLLTRRLAPTLSPAPAAPRAAAVRGPASYSRKEL